MSCKETASAQFCLFCTFHGLIKLSSCILPMGATMTPPLRATLRQSSIMRSRSLVTLTTQLELLGESYMHIKEGQRTNPHCYRIHPKVLHIMLQPEQEQPQFTGTIILFLTLSGITRHARLCANTTHTLSIIATPTYYFEKS